MNAPAETLPQRLAAVQARIAQAAQAASRPVGSVQLLAVSKTFGAEVVAEALRAGLNAFGENYVQEALDKMAMLAGGPAFSQVDGPPEWHFIGPVQSNKTRQIAEHFQWVHSVDRLKIAQRLAEQRPAASGPLNLCIQVNISREATKAGCAPEETVTLVQAVQALARAKGLARIRLRGLMAIPAPAQDGFLALRQLFEQCRAAMAEDEESRAGFDTLSMGMSDDLEAAIAQGATIIRVGSALFGRRAPG